MITTTIYSPLISSDLIAFRLIFVLSTPSFALISTLSSAYFEAIVQ
jgi:hypothetical protein